jgi:CheY-like chemotaxis protein
VSPTLGEALPAAAPVAAGRVLVLDDEPSIRIFLAKALVAIGYEAVVTSTGGEAIVAAREGMFAALVVDHQMQGMSGIDVYREIVAERPELAQRFVMISGDVLNGTLATFAADNGVTLLAKPFDLDTLERTVRAVERT